MPVCIDVGKCLKIRLVQRNSDTIAHVSYYDLSTNGDLEQISFKMNPIQWLLK